MRLLRHFTKRGQAGQSLVILAVGFIALLGFVGIVTDVSVLFIRYSTMRRAVDAAAIAAAGQMRRVIDETPSDGISQGEATSIANLNLAARQFIEVYGLNPKEVLVETCRAQRVDYNPLTGEAIDSAGVPLLLPNGDPNPAADAAEVDRYRELCTLDELKLVRVTAQFEAPTIFLSMLGYPSIILTESAISQTAVIDVVLIFDVSESMLNETEYDDWDTLTPQQGVRYMPPYIFPGDNGSALPPIAPATSRNSPWQQINDNTQLALNARINPSLVVLDNDFQDKIIMFEPTTASPGPTDWQVFVDGSATGRVQPREFCRVRAYPSTIYGNSSPPPELRQEYFDFFQNVYSVAVPGEDYSRQFGGVANDPVPPVYYSGFVPMYNSYACCNDPDGNMSFGDLVCQPFREARDAAVEFLARLDFLRGDRVAFVAFDRVATPIDPDGSGLQATMIETERTFLDSGGAVLRKGAVETLQDVIGVRAETSGYHDNNNDGLWDELVDGDTYVATYRDYNSYLGSVNISQIGKHPVRGACPFDKAVLDTFYLDAAGQILPDDNPRGTPLLEDVITVPAWYTGGLKRFRSYEFRASCAGTNIGGALAGGSATLYNEGRREGSVWIMVLLSDGAAGATNPVYRIGADSISPPQPYRTVTTAGGATAYSPLMGLGGPITGSQVPTGAAGYGAYGLCPYGQDGAATQLLSYDRFPYCSDLQPESRNFCGTVSVMPDVALNAGDPNCIHYYNVDDYARDWADWVAVAELPGSASGGSSGRVGDQLLPTIFSIGFGLNYDVARGTTIHTLCSDTDYDCIRGLDAAAFGDTPNKQRDRNSDYLGEELLRYIGDVGDNFQIDNDYWQVQMGTRIENSIDFASSSPNWGPRGACEQDTWTGLPNDRGNVFLPTPPRESCGNYFVASTGAELEVVFNEIASRMFTRLSQ